ncbi:PucR family transcriptional regulator [Nocardioides seonyuensis]|uniref:PucR family transcriptional regulator n=1 Tax=Nocardioides seonyuensis TaxID=2518371 RepID=A0A4P7IKA8_9ACTN|nr:helix-turn-helix domain-containing protein [Nocardioides seonyuensis]QBX57240.1 PucR family transcriptional regulator [Nocardioides seonyuensis]
MPNQRAVRHLADVLRAETDSLALRLVGESVERIPEYAALSSDGYDETFVTNVRKHLEVFHDLLVGGVLDEALTSFAYRSAAARARQGLPLAAILQSYQVVTRGIWHWLTTHDELRDDPEVVRLSWPLWLDYTDRATRASADAFTVVARERNQADVDARRTFIDMLLSGRVVGLEWMRWLSSFGYDRVEAGFCLVVVQWWDEGGYRVMDAVGRTARSVAERLRAATGVAPIDAVRDREVVLLVSADGIAPERIREEVERSLSARPVPGLEVSGAISRPATRPEALVDAYSHVRRAVAVTRGTGKVALVDQIGLFDHAVAALRSDVRSVTSPRVAGFVVDSVRDPRDSMLGTLRAWVESNMNVGACAAALHVHRNTVYYRLRQVEETTGLDPQSVSGLTDLMVALRLADELTGTTEQPRA